MWPESAMSAVDYRLLPNQVSSELTSFWRDRPTFVTGATGLLGGWLVKDLVERGASVTCLVRDWVPHSVLLGGELASKVTIVRGDVRDQSMLERALGENEIDTVMHLAAQTIVPIANRNPVSTFESNIAGTWSMLEACRRSPKVKQIVYASSDKAYGESTDLPYEESTPLRGRFPYDVSKSCGDLIAQSYASTYDLPVAITRCGNFFGGGDLNWNRLVPGTIRAALRGERPMIRSDGTLLRDYFYVEDGAAAYSLLAERLAVDPELRGEAFNFSNEIQLSVREMVERILGLMGKGKEFDMRSEAPNEIAHQSLSASRARNELGWTPQFSLDEGLARTIAWYDSFLAAGND
jgi:CDP-glucose 4,6-dehydratase